MGQQTLVPYAGEVELGELKVEGYSRLVMVLRPSGEESRCPSCGRPSRRLHSRYCRRLSDLPWEGIPVRIELRVRRFFCGTKDCGQHIFTERLPKTVQRYARRTCRLSASLEQITLALGGAAGARLAEQLGILANGSTLLRQLRRKVITVSADAPRVLGIDDWAWRKGRRYGTILCDLERGKVVDLLPDRSTESTAQWLRAHPGTEIVSRDRASLYAEAATKAAPHAVQVADRWHLLHNLSGALISTLVPHHRLLAEVAQAVSGRSGATTASVAEPLPAALLMSRKRGVQQQNRERRVARYESVMEQMRQGKSQREIARSCGLARKTVRRWISAHSFPERRPSCHSSTIDQHRSYLEQRWQQGCRNAAQLWRELRGQGFDGQSRTVRDWIRKYCGSQKQREEPGSTVSSPLRTSPRQVAWLLLKQPEQSRLYLEELCARSPEIANCASVAREFCRIVRQRDVAAWPHWRDATSSGPLSNFARHLCRDEAAVLAALQQPWSNGPVEGHVHRLKLIKRSMYGRANFDLLRLRVIDAA
jgi:transposase